MTATAGMTTWQNLNHCSADNGPRYTRYALWLGSYADLCCNHNAPVSGQASWWVLFSLGNHSSLSHNHLSKIFLHLSVFLAHQPLVIGIKFCYRFSLTTIDCAQFTRVIPVGSGLIRSEPHNASWIFKAVGSGFGESIHRRDARGLRTQAPIPKL